MMAPDSQREMSELLGSVMAGTRPLGLTDSKGSVVVVVVVSGLGLGLSRSVLGRKTVGSTYLGAER